MSQAIWIVSYIRTSKEEKMMMKAMVLKGQNKSLEMMTISVPEPSTDQLLVQVYACGVCRTDLHILDGELNNPKYPLVLGHQIVGRVVKIGKGVKEFQINQLVGIPWLGKTCQQCEFCLAHKENLCDSPILTGYNQDGGFAEYCCANANFCFPLPESSDLMQYAPLLCGGLIGYRSYRKCLPAKTIGMFGFGSAAHILTQIAVQDGKEVYAFTKDNDKDAQLFAKSLGASWAGSSNEVPPVKLDAVIIFAPVGALVPTALKILKKGGKVVCAGIHMSDIPSIQYKDLWEERSIESVANLTKQDGIDFFKRMASIKVEANINVYELSQANKALDDLRNGRFQGSAVLKIL